MNAQILFGLSNQLAILCWLVLASSLWLARLRPLAQWIGRFGLPMLLGGIYVAVYLVDPDQAEGGFSTLEGVRSLFASDWILLIAWLHYLVFDYFVGAWIVRDSLGRATNPLLVLPCLFFCLMAGPAGLLLYLVVRGGLQWTSRTA